MKTVYYVQSFSKQPTGKKGRLKLEADTPVECKTAQEAINKAERLSEFREGVIAVSQGYDEATEEMDGYDILASFGNVPVLAEE